VVEILAKNLILIYVKSFADDTFILYAEGESERWEGESFYLAKDAVKTAPWFCSKLVRFGFEYMYFKEQT